MGYVPPSAPLVTETLDDAGSRLRHRQPVPSGQWRFASPDAVSAILNDLYGHPSRSWFMVLNYALLACMFALAGAVLWLVFA